MLRGKLGNALCWKLFNDPKIKIILKLQLEFFWIGFVSTWEDSKKNIQLLHWLVFQPFCWMKLWFHSFSDTNRFRHQACFVLIFKLCSDLRVVMDVDSIYLVRKKAISKCVFFIYVDVIEIIPLRNFYFVTSHHIIYLVWGGERNGLG